MASKNNSRRDSEDPNRLLRGAAGSTIRKMHERSRRSDSDSAIIAVQDKIKHRYVKKFKKHSDVIFGTTLKGVMSDFDLEASLLKRKREANEVALNLKKAKRISDSQPTGNIDSAFNEFVTKTKFLDRKTGSINSRKVLHLPKRHKVVNGILIAPITSFYGKSEANGNLRQRTSAEKTPKAQSSEMPTVPLNKIEWTSMTDTKKEVWLCKKQRPGADAKTDSESITLFKLKDGTTAENALNEVMNITSPKKKDLENTTIRVSPPIHQESNESRLSTGSLKLISSSGEDGEKTIGGFSKNMPPSPVLELDDEPNKATDIETNSLGLSNSVPDLLANIEDGTDENDTSSDSELPLIIQNVWSMSKQLSTSTNKNTDVATEKDRCNMLTQLPTPLKKALTDSDTDRKSTSSGDIRHHEHGNHHNQFKYTAKRHAIVQSKRWHKGLKLRIKLKHGSDPPKIIKQKHKSVIKPKSPVTCAPSLQLNSTPVVVVPELEPNVDVVHVWSKAMDKKETGPSGFCNNIDTSPAKMNTIATHSAKHMAPQEKLFSTSLTSESEEARLESTAPQDISGSPLAAQKIIMDSETAVSNASCTHSNGVKDLSYSYTLSPKTKLHSFIPMRPYVMLSDILPTLTPNQVKQLKPPAEMQLSSPLPEVQQPTTASDGCQSVPEVQQVRTASDNCLSVSDVQQVTTASDDCQSVPEVQQVTTASDNCLSVSDVQQVTTEPDDCQSVPGVQQLTTASDNCLSVSDVQQLQSVSNVQQSKSVFENANENLHHSSVPTVKSSSAHARSRLQRLTKILHSQTDSEVPDRLRTRSSSRTKCDKDQRRLRRRHRSISESTDGLLREQFAEEKLVTFPTEIPKCSDIPSSPSHQPTQESSGCKVDSKLHSLSPTIKLLKLRENNENEASKRTLFSSKPKQALTQHSLSPTIKLLKLPENSESEVNKRTLFASMPKQSSKQSSAAAVNTDKAGRKFSQVRIIKLKAYYEVVIAVESVKKTKQSSRLAKEYNFFGAAALRELISAFSLCQKAKKCKAVLLSSTGPVFSSGLDPLALLNCHLTSEPSQDIMALTDQLMDVLIDFSKPIIAAVQGPAVGLGASLLLFCDSIYASERARIQWPAARMGLNECGCASYLLPKVVGPCQARSLLLEGSILTAKEAKSLGIVKEVFPHDSYLGHAMTACRNICVSSTTALYSMKELLLAADKESLRNCKVKELAMLKNCLKSAECNELLQQYILTQLVMV